LNKREMRLKSFMEKLKKVANKMKLS